MKYFFFSFLMLISSLSFSQEKSLTESFKIDMCNCFRSQSLGDFNSRFGLCFEEIRSLSKYSESEYKVADSESEGLFVRTIIELISSCDTIGNEAILWYSNMLPQNKFENKSKEINRLNLLIDNEENKDSLLANLGFRMELYYNERNIKNTMKDILRIQQLDTNNVTSRIIEADIYFHNKQFDDAIKCYEKIRSITKSNQFDIFIAIIQRSKKLNFK